MTHLMHAPPAAAAPGQDPAQDHRQDSGDQRPRQAPLIGLQYLRGLAALSVLGYHTLLELIPQTGRPSFGVELLAGGVDVFFVISGFIIWQSTLDHRRSPAQWWVLRLVRIVPMYWLALGVTLVYKAAAGLHLPGVLEAIKAFLFIPVADSKTGVYVPFLGVGWTLNYEFMFYAVVALSLMFRRASARLLFIGLVFLSLVAARKFIDPSHVIAFRVTSPLMLEFLAGIAIALVLPGFAKTRWRIGLGIGSLALALLFVLGVSARIFDSDGARTVYFGVPAALTVFGVILLEPLLRRHVVRPLVGLGDASFSLYLFHTLVIALVIGLLRDFAGAPPALVGLLSMLAALLLALLIYRRVEAPLLRWMRQRVERRPAPPASVGLAPTA